MCGVSPRDRSKGDIAYVIAGLLASIFSGAVAYVDLVLGDEQLGSLIFNLDWVIGTMTAWCRSHRAKRGTYIGSLITEATSFLRACCCVGGVSRQYNMHHAVRDCQVRDRHSHHHSSSR